jgi:hypothetical protein
LFVRTLKVSDWPVTGLLHVEYRTKGRDQQVLHDLLSRIQISPIVCISHRNFSGVEVHFAWCIILKPEKSELNLIYLRSPRQNILPHYLELYVAFNCQVLTTSYSEHHSDMKSFIAIKPRPHLRPGRVSHVPQIVSSNQTPAFHRV